MTDGLPATIAQWHEAIAEKVGTTPETVIDILDSFGVKAQPILPRARTVNVSSIRFEGEKRAKDSTGRFAFEWKDLDKGLWLLLSEGNSKGKSSVLLTVRAALQGRFPGRVKPDIWSWIDSIDIEFKIDGLTYALSVRKASGRLDEKEATATLVRRDGASDLELYVGPADDGLEGAVGDLFMEELGLEPFHAYRAGQEGVVEHGWPSMSSALFITGSSKAVFGEHTEDSQPLRLIQLFIGLPWVSTYTAIASSLRRVKDVSDKKRKTSAAEASRISARVTELNKLLESKKDALSKLPDRTRLRLDLDRLDREAAAAQLEVSSKRNEINELRSRVMQAVAAHTEARRLLQQARDEAAAGYVFRKLKPVCCPACESGFRPGRFEATEATTCGLCGSDEVRDGDDDAADISALELAVKDADAARKSATAAVAKTEKALGAADGTRDEAMRAMRRAERQLSEADTSVDLAREIAIIEGRLEELGLPPAADVHEPESELLTIKVLEKAQDLTKEMMEALQAEIMKEVEGETFDFAERLGVKNLETLSFKPHRMEIRQGGVDTFFGKLNDGENLRMRVAASLATLKISRKRGFGRHPGLLILDSPAAPEMSAEDFSQLVSAVGGIVSDIEGIQVIVGAVNRSELEGVVDFDHRREAVGSAELF